MLGCKLCDYYRAIGSNPVSYGETAKCEFTGMLFSDVETLDIDYPCRDISYDQYLRHNFKTIVCESAFKINNDDWRYVYKHCHAADATDRYLRRAI